MSVPVNLSRDGLHTSWGFTLRGGKDLNEAFTIKKVTDNRRWSMIRREINADAIVIDLRFISWFKIPCVPVTVLIVVTLDCMSGPEIFPNLHPLFVL